MKKPIKASHFFFFLNDYNKWVPFFLLLSVTLVFVLAIAFDTDMSKKCSFSKMTQKGNSENDHFQIRRFDYSAIL